MRWEDYIESRADVLRGKPYFTGTLITVDRVCRELAKGKTLEKVTQELMKGNPQLRGARVCRELAKGKTLKQVTHELAKGTTRGSTARTVERLLRSVPGLTRDQIVALLLYLENLGGPDDAA